MPIIFAVVFAVASFGFGWKFHETVKCHAPRPKIIKVERLEVSSCVIEKTPALPGTTQSLEVK